MAEMNLCTRFRRTLALNRTSADIAQPIAHALMAREDCASLVVFLTTVLQCFPTLSLSIFITDEDYTESTAIHQVLLDAVIHLCPGETCSHSDRILKLFRTAGDRYPTSEHILVPSDQSSAVTPQPLESSVASCGSQQPQLQVGDWCMVLYDGREFPGTVTTVAEDNVELSMMVPAGIDRS